MTFALAARSPNSLEPAFVVQGADNWVNMQIFDNLVRPEDGTFAVTPRDFKPSLAESWTSSADGRTWTFQLRKGVKFHGGYGGVTADDVKFTFRSLGDFASASSDFSTLRAIPAIVSASARAMRSFTAFVRVGAIVRDPVTAQDLKVPPALQAACFHDSYLQAFQRAGRSPDRHRR